MLYTNQSEGDPLERVIGILVCVGGVGLESPAAFGFQQLPRKH